MVGKVGKEFVVTNCDFKSILVLKIAHFTNQSLVLTTDFKSFLDDCVERFNQPSFIENDPIGVPRRFSKLQDIEITAFWTAMLAWGQRKTIINKANELFGLMDNAPHDFILNHQEHDRKAFLGFVHRTFQATDTLYFLEFFQTYKFQ